MRFLRKTLVGLSLMAVTFGLVFYAGFMVLNALDQAANDAPRGGNARERVFAVNVVTFEPGEFAPMLKVFGSVQSRRALDVRSSIGGVIVDLHPNFRDGGAVKSGEVLLRIDPSDAQTRLDLARADWAEAQADVGEAERALILAQDEVIAAEEQARLRVKALQRQNDLVSRGVGTEAQLETAELAASSAKQAILSRRQALQTSEARLDQMKSRLVRLEISVKDAERQLSDTTIFAGFDGVLSGVSIVQGGTVAPNERIGELVDPDSLEVAFRLSTGQHQRLLNDDGKLVNADLTVKLDILGAEINAKGRITREAPVVGDGLTGRLVFANLETPKGFRPGDFVEVLIAEPPLQWVAQLPASALSAANTVLVIGDQNRLSEAEVQLIRRQGENVLLRARGLQGARIVAERSPVLGAGIKVRPLSPNAEDEIPAAPETIKLDDERRAKLIAFVESNKRIPKQVRERMLAQLKGADVPKQMVDRLERRMGG